MLSYNGRFPSNYLPSCIIKAVSSRTVLIVIVIYVDSIENLPVVDFVYDN